jgi:hypothetical protein
MAALPLVVELKKWGEGVVPPRALWAQRELFVDFCLVETHL